MAWFVFASHASAALVISTSNQTGAVPFTPSWTPASGSLIAGSSPSTALGDFSKEASGRSVNSLTAGGSLTINSISAPSSTCSTNYITCGNGNDAGSTIIYTLPASTNGFNLTNITVYGGWQDNGRDAQAYTVYYSSVTNPAEFTGLTSVAYDPSVSSGIASATRVSLDDSAGGIIAANVAALKFDFMSPGSENGYTGYGAITVQGVAATNLVVPSIFTPTMNTVLPASATEGADSVLVFNEIMYHPALDEAGMEWVEFYNQMAVDIDVSGWTISGDTDYVFPAGTRVPGRSYIVLARDPVHLQAVTGLSSNVFGPFVSPLDNNGGTLSLYNHAGRLMDRLEFGTELDWPVSPDGAGPSLAKIDCDWATGAPANWKASRHNGGTPGAENFASPAPPVTVVMNEFSGTTNGPFWVELLNYGSNVVALGNCILHHDGVTNTDYVFPPGMTLSPGAFLVLSNGTLGFVAPDSGEKLFLFATNQSEVYDALVLKKAPRARSPDGTGSFLTPNLLTPGASNSFAVHGELVINEIMYNHQAFPPANTNVPPQDNPEEWLEIYNRSSNSVSLTGWSLDGGITYQFSAGQTIAPGGFLVVAKDAATLRATYPMPEIVGNYSGRLGNGDEIILRDPLGNPADQVHYYRGGRWPQFASGGGSSLELLDATADNSRAEAWAASNESGKSSWQTFTYRKAAEASATPAPDNQWRDFVLGLLGDGECWVDDISVIQSPTNNPVQLITNGNFESGLTGWRLLGNHRRSVLEPDPDNAGNQVLHVVASGPQEHMHNHIEATLARAVTNGLLYEISFRARWITGNRRLNTRLYFNRVARTTELPAPQLNGTPGAINSCSVPNIGPTFAQFQHQPVVPSAGQPVTVFVRAQDPQGVSACAVWWSVNGGAWSSASMTLTNGVYAGTIPGAAASSLVQFYLRAVDGLGAVTTFPAAGINSGAFYRVNEGLGNVAQTHNLRILMSPENVALQYATTNLMSNENLPCTVIYDERQVHYDMKVRLKSSQRGRVEAARIGFHLEFNPDDLFRGVHPVMLMDRSGGGSRPAQEEILLRHMADHAGVPAVNADLCRVVAPQSAQNGMTILSPRFEDNFVATSFAGGGDGTLYELELTYYPLTANAAGFKLPQPDNVQGVDFSDFGDDQETYRYNFIIKNHRSTDGYAALIRLAKMWDLNGAPLDAGTRLTMDVDEWLRAYALVSLGGVSDMYTFGGSHNLIAYLRPGDGKFLYFPWDMDFSFSRAATDPLIGDQNLSKIVNLPGNLRRFYAHLVDHINTTYNTGYMTYWVNHYGAKSGQNYAGDLSYISQRANFALSTINSAGGNTAFSVIGAAVFNVSSNLVTLSGTAPVGIASILINGVSYPVTWSSISGWTVQVPVGAVTNVLNVQGYDLKGNLLTNTTRTAVFNGAIAEASQSVVFNEIMYSPATTNADYVELFNSATNFSFDLSGWRVNGLGYTFPSGSILFPNSYLILAKDRTAFVAAHGDTLPVFDVFDGEFDSDGETITLFRPDPVQTNAEIVVDRVRYEATAPWPVPTIGSSLQLRDAAQDNSRAANWSVVTTNGPGFAQQWVRVSATGIPRTTAISRPLYVYLQSAGDIYLDDFSVVAGSTAEVGVNVITNAGFETSLTPWVIGSDGNNSASVVSTNLKHSGNNSLHLITSSGGATQNSSIWQEFSSTLTVGATYTLSFWYLPSANGGPLTVRFAGSGIIITTNPAPVVPVLAIATPGTSNSVAATLPAFPSAWLNEAQPANVAGPTNDSGARTPWVELHNAGTNALSLAGLYLSDNYTNLTRWAFPSNSLIAANGFMVVWCDGQTNQSVSNALHTSFSLPASAGSIVLARLSNQSVPQVVDYLNYTNVPANWSHGDFPDGQPFFRAAMFKFTPGATNSNAAIPITVAINEWMADGNHTLANPLGGQPDDWFELFNYGTNTVDLGGYYLTDALTNKTKFLIPNNQHYLIPPNGYFLVWADNGSAANSTNCPELHVNFALSKGGEALGLFAADGTAIDSLTFGAQTTDVSQGRFPDGALDIFAMPTPTPQTNNLIPNTAPVLAALSDRFVHAGQTLQFLTTATDPQSAYQTLTFSLSNAPAGASINAASGAFSWTTTNAVAPGTNLITVRVTDNGTPPMSDIRTFSAFIFAQPQLGGVSPAGDGIVQITFNTLPGQNYQIQFKASLADAEWTALGETVSGNGLSATIYDDMTGQSQRFYRLLAIP